jgi:hypothetical protein
MATASLKIVGSLMRETIFTNGSKIEVLGSTPEAVNGPHPQKSHADEIELMRDDTWRESRNMTISKKLKDGRVIRPAGHRHIHAQGSVWSRAAAHRRDREGCGEGYKPPRKLYIWCIKETASQVKNCRVARPDLPDPFKCPCHKIRKGEWERRSASHLGSDLLRRLLQEPGWQPFGKTS